MKLDEWLSQLGDELGIADVELDDRAVGQLLEVARDAAHQVERVAAPLTTFLLGVAVGRGQSLDAAAAVTTSALSPEVPPPQ